MVALGSTARCGECVESGDDGQDDAGPTTAGGEVQDGASGADGETAGGGQQAQPEWFRFPAPGLVRGGVGGVGAAEQLQQASRSAARATISHQI